MDRRYPERPFVGVGVVVWRGDEVLLVKRGQAPAAGTWSIPGGLQQTGETVAQAAAREVREEAGIEIALGAQIAVVDSIRHDAAGGVLYHYTLVDFVAAWAAGEPVAGDDAAEARWVAHDRLAEYGLWAETARVIGLARARRRE